MNHINRQNSKIIMKVVALVCTIFHLNICSDLSATINKPEIGKPNAEENRHSLKVQSDAATVIDGKESNTHWNFSSFNFFLPTLFLLFFSG